MHKVTHKFTSRCAAFLLGGPLNSMVPTIIFVVPLRIVGVVSSTIRVLFLGIVLRAVLIVVGSPICRGGNRTEETLIVTSAILFH